MADDAREAGSKRTGTTDIDTRALGATQGHATWTSAVTSSFGQLDVGWLHPRKQFRGELSGRKFGSLYVSTIRADPHAVSRTPEMIGSTAPRDYLLCVVTSGRLRISQSGRSTRLENGSFTLLDPASPFWAHAPSEFENIVVQIPRSLLNARLPIHAAETITAHAISGRVGPGRVVSTLLQQFATGDTEMPADAASAFSASALDMVVATFFDGPLGASSTTLVHLQDLRRAQDFLKTHMYEPNLSMSDLAHELGMSVRYLQNLFHGIETTPTNWLRQARLERARQLLNTHITISDLSSIVGFKDVSHFSRTFRRQFGMSPGKYRKDHTTASPAT